MRTPSFGTGAQARGVIFAALPDGQSIYAPVTQRGPYSQWIQSGQAAAKAL
jgi:hypothetical protein